MNEIEKPNEGAAKVSIQGNQEDGQTVSLGSEDALCKLFHTNDDMQANALLAQCLKSLRSTEASDEHPANDERVFMLSIIRDLKPRDAVERMLAVQMAVTHVATIRSARWLANSEKVVQAEANYSGYNKLARTFAAQIETLRKYRNGGEQKVTVQHVTVSDGGQAIVGNVQSQGGG